MKPLLALQHLQALRGSSLPQLFRCSDGEYYVVKFQDNPQGRRILINEMLGTRLAQMIGLPVPDAAIIFVDDRTIDNTPALRQSRTRCVFRGGLQYGSKFVCDPFVTPAFDFLPDSYLPQIVNPEVFVGAFVFDQWTCNSDARQFVFHVPDVNIFKTRPRKPGDYKATLVDHGFCFNGTKWDFHPMPLLGKFLTHFHSQFRTTASLTRWILRVEQLSSRDLTDAAAHIPADWFNEDRREFRQLISTLDRRRAELKYELIRYCDKEQKSLFAASASL